MGIWHTRQTASLRGNRFCRCPERSHCCDLYVFRQPALSWTLLPAIHESRTFVGNPDCASVGEKSRYRSPPTASVARRVGPKGGSREAGTGYLCPIGGTSPAVSARSSSSCYA